MCYVVAKNADAAGCVAIKMEQGPSVVALKKEMNAKFSGKKIQVMTISRPSAYGEYAPYRIVDATDAFKQKVSRLANINKA